MTDPSLPDDLATAAETTLRATIGGTLADLAGCVHPDATNRESLAEPPAARGHGPQAFHATGEWLREAFSDLVWTTEQSIAEGDTVVTYGTLSGRHTGNFVVWTPDEAVERVFVPTGLTYSVRQAHFQRFRDGLVVEHWAVRDDQGMAMQAGWIPPTPGFLLRCARATRKARRAADPRRADRARTDPSHLTPRAGAGVP